MVFSIEHLSPSLDSKEGGEPVTAFFALLPKGSFAADLAKEVAPYVHAEWLHPGDWNLAPVESLHLTVLYCGKVPLRSLPHLIEIGRQIAPEVGVVGLHNGRIEHVATIAPNMIWLRFEREVVFDGLIDKLERLFAQFSNWKNVPARIVSGDPYPLPHITLAQAASAEPRDLRNGRIPLPERLRSCACDRLALIIKRKGSAHDYEVIQEWTLGERTTNEKHHILCVPGFERSNVHLGMSIGEMRFDAMLQVLMGIFTELNRQATKDCENGRAKLAAALFDAEHGLEATVRAILAAHKIAVPFMSHEFAMNPESQIVAALEESFESVAPKSKVPK